MRTIAVALVVMACGGTKSAEDKPAVARAALTEYARAFEAWMKGHPTKLCPSAIGELTHYLTEEYVKDPWGRPYALLCDPAGVVSDGPDGKPDTADDVSGTFTTDRPAVAPVAAQPSNEPAAIVVTARQLFDDYSANEVGADEKYRGKTLRVTGIVNRIAKDIADEAFVELAAPRQSTIHARFANLKGVGSLARNQAITIRCRGDGMSLGGPVLQDCVLE